MRALLDPQRESGGVEARHLVGLGGIEQPDQR
jgi:hypothetical protein